MTVTVGLLGNATTLLQEDAARHRMSAAIARCPVQHTEMELCLQRQRRGLYHLSEPHSNSYALLRRHSFGNAPLWASRSALISSASESGRFVGNFDIHSQ